MGTESTKRCGRCGGAYPLESFAWRRKARGQRDTFCRACRSAYGKQHYAANRQRYIDQAALLKRKLAFERTAALIQHFDTHPCVDCGERDPIVLEFDHLADKNFDIGAELTNRSWSDILAEIEKCEVVCANCHRRRTARRRRSLRFVLVGAAGRRS